MMGLPNRSKAPAERSGKRRFAANGSPDERSNTSRREWAFWYFDDPRDYDMIDWGIRLYQIDFGG